MINACAPLFTTETLKLLAVSLSFVFSGIFLVLLKKLSLSAKPKIVLIYSHLLALFFPFILLTTNAGCAAVCAACYTNIYQLLSLAVPSTLIISTIAGFALIPTVFIYSNRKSEITEGRVSDFVKSSSKKLKIKQPRLYTLNTSKPVAFSFRNFRSAVFLSVGLFDILKWKEVQAVILHELAHIKQKSSSLKLSTFMLRVFSPLSVLLKFQHKNTEEEEKADLLAIRMQKTDKHIRSARRKLVEYSEVE